MGDDLTSLGHSCMFGIMPVLGMSSVGFCLCLSF